MFSSLTTTAIAVDDETVDAGHPLALGDAERLDRRALDRFQHVLWQVRRDHELHPALVVLRLIVVPLVAEWDDLAGDDAIGLTIAEHADLDLDPVEKLLDQDLVVVAEGKLDRSLELGLVVRLADPDRGSEPRGLDEAGEAEGVLDRIAFA